MSGARTTTASRTRIPGFIDHVVNKKAEIVRVYLPPDANCLLSVADHCLRSRDYVNVIVAGKQPALDYLTMDEAIAHCTRGHRASGSGRRNDDGERARRRARLRRRHPDARDASPRRRSCASTCPSCACACQRRRPDAPAARVRAPARAARRASSTRCSPADRPVIFAYHGYPWLIHRLTYRRANHHNIHVRGYKEEGTTTTPFDMVMLNDLDRYHLVMDVIDRVPGLGERAARLRQEMADERLRHRAYTREYGDDPPEVRDWTWPGAVSGSQPLAVRVLVVNAGSSSVKLRAARRRRRDARPSASSPRRGRSVDPARSSRARRRPGRGRRGRAPDRARRRALPRGGRIDGAVEHALARA